MNFLDPILNDFTSRQNDYIQSFKRFISGEYSEATEKEVVALTEKIANACKKYLHRNLYHNYHYLTEAIAPALNYLFEKKQSLLSIETFDCYSLQRLHQLETIMRTTLKNFAFQGFFSYSKGIGLNYDPFKKPDSATYPSIGHLFNPLIAKPLTVFFNEMNSSFLISELPKCSAAIYKKIRKTNFGWRFDIFVNFSITLGDRISQINRPSVSIRIPTLRCTFGIYLFDREDPETELTEEEKRKIVAEKASFLFCNILHRQNKRSFYFLSIEFVTNAQISHEKLNSLTDVFMTKAATFARTHRRLLFFPSGEPVENHIHFFQKIKPKNKVVPYPPRYLAATFFSNEMAKRLYHCYSIPKVTYVYENPVASPKEISQGLTGFFIGTPDENPIIYLLSLKEGQKISWYLLRNCGSAYFIRPLLPSSNWQKALISAAINGHSLSEETYKEIEPHWNSAHTFNYHSDPQIRHVEQTLVEKLEVCFFTLPCFFTKFEPTNTTKPLFIPEDLVFLLEAFPNLRPYFDDKRHIRWNALTRKLQTLGMIQSRRNLNKVVSLLQTAFDTLYLDFPPSKFFWENGEQGPLLRRLTAFLTNNPSFTHYNRLVALEKEQPSLLEG
jgi:hypothetical protein